MLIQHRADLQHLVAEHRGGFAPATGRRINNIDELDQLFVEAERELLRINEGLEGHITSASMGHVMGRENVTPDEVTVAAATVIDYYKDLLLLARNTRGGYRAR